MKRYALFAFLLICSIAHAETIAEKLTRIDNEKTAIKSAIEAKGQSVTTFETYSEAVASISTGGMFEVVATVNNAECGGAVTASQPAVICSPTSTGPWLPVATAPVAAAYPSGGWGVYDNIGMSLDGQYLAMVHKGTSAPKYLSTYIWDAGSSSFKLTDDPTDPSGGLGGAIAMSGDGARLIVGTWSGTAENVQYYYWGSAGYLLGTEPADVSGIASSRCCEMNGAGNRLVILNSSTPYFTTFEYSAASGTYLQTTNADAALGGLGYGLALDYSGDRLLADSDKGTILHSYIWDGSKYTKTGATQPDIQPTASASYLDMSMDGIYAVVPLRASPYLETYKYDSVDSRFEKMPRPAGINGACTGAAIASDGTKIFVTGDFTSPNYFAVLELDKTKNQYALVQNAASAPGSTGRGCAVSGNGNRIAVAEVNANYLRLYNLSATYTQWFVYPLQDLGSAFYPRYFGYAESSGSASDTVTFKAYWHQDEYTGFEE